MEAQLGNLKWVHLPGNLRGMKVTLEMGHLSVRERYVGNLEGGSYTGDPGGSVTEGSGDGLLSS
jgi:hypothetical protein